eukprot:scaffold3405_cov167-Amphora_coffeaeformis.AAC.1
MDKECAMGGRPVSIVRVLPPLGKSHDAKRTLEEKRYYHSTGNTTSSVGVSEVTQHNCRVERENSRRLRLQQACVC